MSACRTEESCRMLFVLDDGKFVTDVAQAVQSFEVTYMDAATYRRQLQVDYKAHGEWIDSLGLIAGK